MTSCPPPLQGGASLLKGGARPPLIWLGGGLVPLPPPLFSPLHSLICTRIFLVIKKGKKNCTWSVHPFLFFILKISAIKTLKKNFDIPRKFCRKIWYIYPNIQQIKPYTFFCCCGGIKLFLKWGKIFQENNSFWHKLKFSNHYFFKTWWCNPYFKLSIEFHKISL